VINPTGKELGQNSNSLLKWMAYYHISLYYVVIINTFHFYSSVCWV